MRGLLIAFPFAVLLWIGIVLGLSAAWDAAQRGALPRLHIEVPR